MRGRPFRPWDAGDSRPPWWQGDRDRPAGYGPREWHRKRRFLFLRFGMVFSAVMILVLGGMAALAFVLTRLFGGSGPTALLVWIGGCGLTLVLPVLAVRVAIRAFRRIAMPMADVMAAADAVAAGDLSVRVPVRGSGEMARLAQSFNRMAEELARADQQRRNLTADVAHELRTPLHIIQGNLEGVLDGVYEPSPEHIGATLDETRSLSRLVEDLRTLSLAEAGQLPLERNRVDLVDLLDDVTTSFSGQAEAAGISLQAEHTGDPETLAVAGDAGRLDQVLGNLVVNALRHTPAGGSIILRAEPLTDPGESGVRLTITDTGEGIAPEDLPFIFDRFWRADRSRTRGGGSGSGLGLAITRQLVQLHGGRIEVQSQPGHGTTFTIVLPARHDGRPATADPDAR